MINHTGDKWFAWETSEGPLIYLSTEKPAMQPQRIGSLDLLLTFVSRQK